MSAGVQPESVNGCPVVLAVMLPDAPGHIYGRHVVIVRDHGVIPDEHSFTVWTVVPREGYWEVTGSGQYNCKWDRAVDVMAERCKRANPS